ncbi:MAG TPA: WS/DGAT domain-containing protein, partial [Usitatibacteraceae bacterium]|nr:WS/DGAT domain-containing protein [Usitatibacteraceae bacterium]
QSGGIGMGVSLLSYNGCIQFGLITDAGLVPDPDRIVARFHDEFEKLMWLTLMVPWEGEELPGPPSGDAATEEPRRPSTGRGKKAKEAAKQPMHIPKRFRNL